MDTSATTTRTLDGQELVAHFHYAFAHPVKIRFPSVPDLPSTAERSARRPRPEVVRALDRRLSHVVLRGLRASLICEEAVELDEAFQARDIVEVADALGDIAYVAYGAGLAFGADVPVLHTEPARAAFLDDRAHEAVVARVVVASAKASHALLSGGEEEITTSLTALITAIERASTAMLIDLGAVFEEIHRSNMSKAWPDGKPRYREDGKVIKNLESYSPAQLAPILGVAA